MEDYVILYRKTDEIVDEKILKKYIFPISSTPLISEIKKLAEFQKEISKKYDKKHFDGSLNENYKHIVKYILTYYEVHDRSS